MINPEDLRITRMTVGVTGASGIVVHHTPTGIGVSCDSERSEYANKEKALTLLTRLIGHTLQDIFDHVNPEYPFAHYFPNKVAMIKELRDLLGLSLRESKDAIDKYGSVEEAQMALTGSAGYCTEGDRCVCGGDLPAIREGCYSWQK